MRRLVLLVALLVALLALSGLSHSGVDNQSLGAVSTERHGSSAPFVQSDGPFNQTYGGPGDQYGRALAATADGYVVAGYAGTDSHDVWLTRLTSAGNPRWMHQYGTGGDQRGLAVHVAGDGFVVAGSTDANDGDAWISKIGPNGSQQWTQTYGGDGAQASLDIVSAVDGNGYLLVGYTNATQSGTLDAWLVRIGPEGDRRWTRRVGPSGTDAARSVLATSDGYVVAGLTNSSRTDELDAWVFRTDPMGQLQRSAVFGADGYDTFWSVESVPGGYLLAGETSSYGAGELDAWVVRTNQSFRTTLNVTVGGSQIESGTDVAPASEGYVLVGRTTHGSGANNALLVGLDVEGQVRWSDIVGGSENEILWMVRRDGADAHVMAGQAGSFDGTGSDGWILRRLNAARTPTATAGSPTPTASSPSSGVTGTPSPPSSPSPAETGTPNASPTAQTPADGPGFALLGALCASGLALVLRRMTR